MSRVGERCGSVSVHAHQGTPPTRERPRQIAAASHTPPATAAEDPPAQLEGIIDALHTRRETREVVVAEVRLAGPRSDDERVVCRDAGLVQHGGGDGVGGEVDIGDLAEQNA